MSCYNVSYFLLGFRGNGMQSAKIYRWSAVFLVTIYLIVPFVDSTVCGDCTRFTSPKDSRNTSAFSINGTNVPPDNPTPQDQTTHKDFCQVCFHAAKIMNSHRVGIELSSVPFIMQTPFQTTQVFTFPINEPPEI